MHSNGMTSCQSSSTENVSRNVAPFFYHHSVVIQHLLSNDKKFCFSLIGLNSIFSTLPQSALLGQCWNTGKTTDKNRNKPEYTSHEVYSLHARYTHCTRGILTAREEYSLHARYTHSEVELRKCCLGQSAKSIIIFQNFNI
jgi:hypothetical protein